MADMIASGIQQAGVEAVVKDICETSAEKMLDYEGIVIGSPTYYGAPAYQVKQFLDESVVYHGRLAGKVGGAFASSANIAGGNETTILALINAFLVHGMIVTGLATGDHYGPVAINSPDTRCKQICTEYGAKLGNLVKTLYP
jgi:NAD(P)H dehydrogenase (quinone)